MHEDFLLLNGDTLIQPAIVERLLASRPAAVAMAVGHKTGYDADDMKVKCTAGCVVRVGKDLQAGDIDGEAIGVSLFRGDGPRLFRDAIEEMLGDADSARRWYLSAVNLLRRGATCARCRWTVWLGPRSTTRRTCRVPPHSSPAGAAWATVPASAGRGRVCLRGASISFALVLRRACPERRRRAQHERVVP